MIFFRRHQNTPNSLKGVYQSVESNDGGSTWGLPRTVVDTDEGQMVYATPIVRSEGKLAVAWSLYSITGDKHFNVYYTESRDGGNTWLNRLGIFSDFVHDSNALKVHETPIGLQTMAWDVIHQGQEKWISFVESAALFGDGFSSSYVIPINGEPTRIGELQNAYYPNGLTFFKSRGEVHALAAGKGSAGTKLDLYSYKRGVWERNPNFLLGIQSATVMARPVSISNTEDRLALTWLEVDYYTDWTNYTTNLSAYIAR